MDNKTLSAFFKEIAFWLEMLGETPFKITAYRNVAFRIEKTAESVEELYKGKRLREIEGVGDALGKKLEEIIETGHLRFLDNLRSQFPPTLYTLSSINGLGPKTIKLLYETFGIDSLPALRDACEQNKLATVKGIGTKKQEKILLALQFAETQQPFFHLHKAWQLASKLCQKIQEEGIVEQIAVVGELRRFCELVKEITILATTDDAPALYLLWNQLAPLEQDVVEDHPAKIEQNSNPIPKHIHIISPSQWPYALLHFTGNEIHLATLKERATSLGLTLTDRALIADDGRMVVCETESDIYHTLGLPYIPPELREGGGEFTLGDPIRLVEEGDIKGMVHCHSTWSDGANTIEELACASQSMGYSYLVLTDHSQSSVIVGGLVPDRVLEQQQEIDTLNARLSTFRIIKGIESDILEDGSLDYTPDVLSAVEFVIASIHHGFEMTEEESTRRLIRAIENPYTSAIGHLTGRLLLSRPGYPVHVKKVVDAAVANGVAIEINANPRRLDMDWRYLYAAAEKGAKFVIGTDAHRILGLNNMRFGVAIARKGGLSPEAVLNCSSVEVFLKWRK